MIKNFGNPNSDIGSTYADAKRMAARLGGKYRATFGRFNDGSYGFAACMHFDAGTKKMARKATAVMA